MKMLQDRLDSHVSIGLIITDPALGQGKWIGSAVLEVWEGTDISLEAQTKAPGEFNLIISPSSNLSP